LVENLFHCPSEFKKQKGKSIPVFLQAYFAQIFDDDGELLPDPSVFAIKHIRQICFLVYKLELPYSPAEEKVVLDNFLRTEEELASIELDHNLDVMVARDFTAGTVYNGDYVNIFGHFDPKDVHPKHGPGAVATGEKGEQKWEFTRLYDSIHQVYPYYSFFIVGGARELIDRKNWYTSLIRLKTGTAKVALVPKDSRGPRLISSEPLEYMWLQKGLGESIVSSLENHFPTRGQINFHSQAINRLLALQASSQKVTPSRYLAEEREVLNAGLPFPSVVDGGYSTLDLKDASDRVSLDLVTRVFFRTPQLLASLLALRTTATCLPDGRQIQLKKYAPMGSALCFPVEAYIFWIIIVAAISRRFIRPPLSVMKEVFVYGDDIIVPTKYASLAISTLEKVGLKVNRNKSCLKGRFRESCGMDAFDGHDVTPIKLHTLWTGDRADGSALVSYTAYANAMRKRGYSEFFYTLKQKIESVYGLIPYGDSRAGYVHWEVATNEEASRLNRELFPSKWRPDLFTYRYKFFKYTAKRFDSLLDGWHRLTRNLMSGPGDDPSVYSLPRRNILKRGWTYLG
jgi:hypothetical protein